MTPREFQVERDAAALRMTDEAKTAMAQAWHTADFYAAASAGQLPPLANVLKRLDQREAPVLTERHHGAVVAEWSAFIGVKARPMSEAAKRAWRTTQS